MKQYSDILDTKIVVVFNKSKCYQIAVTSKIKHGVNYQALNIT